MFSQKTFPHMKGYKEKTNLFSSCLSFIADVTVIKHIVREDYKNLSKFQWFKTNFKKINTQRNAYTFLFSWFS